MEHQVAPGRRSSVCVCIYLMITRLLGARRFPQLSTFSLLTFAISSSWTDVYGWSGFFVILQDEKQFYFLASTTRRYRRWTLFEQHKCNEIFFLRTNAIEGN